jgi:hypothetical protein
MQGFHAGNRKSGIGGADGKHGLLEYTTTHICHVQNWPRHQPLVFRLTHRGLHAG